MLRKIKEHLFISILAAVVIVLIAGVSFALTTITTKTPHEMLNTGVVFVWSDGSGNWQNGLSPGSNRNRSFTVNIGKDRTDVTVKPYNSSNFTFGDPETSHWNETAKCTDKSSYNKNYVPYSVTAGTQSFNYDKNTGNLTITQTVKLSSAQLFDVAYYVRDGNQQEVYDYLGDSIPSGITDPMNKMLTDPNVKGYLYFCPMVINYNESTTVVVEDPVALTAELDLPATGKTNEEYPVKDVTRIPSGATFQSSKLEVSMNNGESYTTVADWPANTLNAQMNDSRSVAIEVKYRLTVFLANGQNATDEKSIVLEDATPQISVDCDVELDVDPGITYTGHPVTLTDRSQFYVTDEDGKKKLLSAQEAYKQGIADNDFSFDVSRSDYTFKSYSTIEKEVAFETTGTKYVTLTVTLKDGNVIEKTVAVEM